MPSSTGGDPIIIIVGTARGTGGDRIVPVRSLGGTGYYHGFWLGDFFYGILVVVFFLVFLVVLFGVFLVGGAIRILESTGQKVANARGRGTKDGWGRAIAGATARTCHFATIYRKLQLIPADTGAKGGRNSTLEIVALQL